MNKEEAFKICLPKWCQMVINGDKITEEQAEEIIRRTDNSIVGMWFSGNNKEFNIQAEQILKFPKKESFKDGDGKVDYKNLYNKVYDWKEKFGVLKDLEYLTNNWISCCWIGGYHGWCHPTGEIAYCNNIGKCAKVEQIYNEWIMIAKEFPFLNLTCTLMNGEEDYCNESLLTIEVKKGEVNFIDTIPYNELEFNGIKSSFVGFNKDKENYYSLDKLQEWADKYLSK